MRNINCYKKKIFSLIFAFAIIMIVGINIIVFPKLLKKTPASSNLITTSNDEVNLNDSNEALGNIVSEEIALKSAQQGVCNDELPDSFDFDTALVVTKYIYESSSFPAQNPKWIIVYINRYNEYDLRIPEEHVEQIGDFAWSQGPIWMNEEGEVFIHYEKYIGYAIAEIDAVTGDYNGVTYMVDENEVVYENSVRAYLERIYNIKIDMDF